ncbi:MAG: hypothetical protein MUD06_15345 [Rhodospirillales bacterium]|jgi:polyhydroxybutyrate depolymerase|nr:hypothetical protein [Rhodospirillales bacterium]
MNATNLLAATTIAAGLAAAGAMPAAAGCLLPSRPQTAGLQFLSIEADGKLREVAIFVPQSYDGATAVPLVLDLHASSITPEIELAITRLDEVAEAQGFLLALPVAIRPFERGGTTWNLPRDPNWPDDVAFLGKLLDTLEATFCIDPGRIFATGYSGGARLASELACWMPERIAAVSAVAGLRGPEPDCPSAASGVPILAIHGLADPVNPYDASPTASPEYWTHGIPEAVERWRSHLGCTGVSEDMATTGVTRLEFAACEGRGAFTLWLHGGGHTWPGSPFAFPEYTGATETNLDATALTVDWFARHPRRSAATASVQTRGEAEVH